MEYSFMLGNFMLTVLYIFEGLFFAVYSFLTDGVERKIALMALAVWALGQILNIVLIRGKNPKLRMIHRVFKVTIITIVGWSSAFLVKDIYFVVIFFLLEWLGCTIIFTSVECFCLCAEQIALIVGYIVGERIVTGNPINYHLLLFCVVVVLMSTWISKNNVDNRNESITRGMIQRRSHEDLIKVVEAKCYEARSATKSKSEFLANMSHEIRTPINAVLGLNEMILRESKESDTLEYAHDIKSAGTTLLNIINDILDFSKIESGKMNLVPVNYDISSLLNDVVNMINLKATEKGISFKLTADASLPRILYGDEVRVKQIITNILTNAVKYTEKGSVELRIGYEKIEDFAILLKVAVKDTGKGMKEEDIEKLFSPFERIEETRNRHIEGTGLGMSITKTFLNMMGSELKVQSVYGTGSTFSFAVRQEVNNWECMGNYEEAFKRLRKDSDIYRSAFRAPDAHILVVDDMPMNLTVFKGLLKETKICIDAVTSGKEAIEKTLENKYDAIFMDHMMPDMDGIETFEKIRTDSNNPNNNTATIILTANAVSGSRDLYMAEGFDDYLSKPIDPERLEKILMNILPQEFILPIDDGFIDTAVVNSTEDMRDDNILSKLRSIPYIITEEGIRAVGDEETYLLVTEEFARSARNRCNMITEYFEAGDIRNYTIQVHGLKSTSRLIGDVELSEMARELENAANEEKYDFVTEKTPELVSHYERLIENLDRIYKDDSISEDKELISDEELEAAIDMINDAVAAFDLDTVESIVNQLGEYRLPDDFVAKYDKCKVYISEVDFESLGKLFGGEN